MEVSVSQNDKGAEAARAACAICGTGRESCRRSKADRRGPCCWGCDHGA